MNSSLFTVQRWKNQWLNTKIGRTSMYPLLVGYMQQTITFSIPFPAKEYHTQNLYSSLVISICTYHFFGVF